MRARCGVQPNHAHFLVFAAVVPLAAFTGFAFRCAFALKDSARLCLGCASSGGCAAVEGPGALLDTRASPPGRDTSGMHDKTISIINKLITVCKDGAQGFELAAVEVKSSALQSLFRGYSLQRSRFSGDLGTAAAALAESAPAETPMKADTSRPPRTQEKLPDDGRTEQAVLSECESKEEAAMAAYATALEEPELPPAIRAMIAAQVADVKAAHKEIHDLSTRFVEAK